MYKITISRDSVNKNVFTGNKNDVKRVCVQFLSFKDKSLHDDLLTSLSYKLEYKASFSFLDIIKVEKI